MDAVAVVVESHFVKKRRADRIGGVHHGAERRISEYVAHRRDVIAAPLRLTVSLGDLLGDPVPEDRELVTELMIDAANFLAHRGR